MTNSALMHRALEYRRLRAQVKLLEAEAKAHSDAVVAELARRELSSTEHAGITVTAKASTRVSWDADALRDLLPRATFSRVTHSAVDNDAMKAEIKAGRIDPDTVAPARTEATGSPYIVVTGDAAA